MGSPSPTHISTVPPFVLAVLFFLPFPSVLSFNITGFLSSYPNLSSFSALLTSTSVAADLSHRSSLTLLAIPNSVLQQHNNDFNSNPALSSPYDLADVVRYHVLLQYLSPDDLQEIPPQGKLVTTLFQTTGRASSNMGAVNLTRDPVTGNITVRSPAPFSTTNVSIIAVVKTLPYNFSVFTVDSFLIPSGLDLAASENRPPATLNVTQVLMDGKDFNVAASMLTASGVADEFVADERGAGITVFVPTDEAFAQMPYTGGERLQSIPADRKAAVLRYHVLHSYYPLGSLESIVNPVQPTLATEDSGAGRFTLNISRVNGSLAIDTGIVQASITRTVFDQNPVAVFAVSKVLLPREIFGGGRGDGSVGNRADEVAVAPSFEVTGYPPVSSPGRGAESPASTKLSSLPGLRGEEVGSGCERRILLFGFQLCIGFFVYLLLLLQV